jgi:hypothetical protein
MMQRAGKQSWYNVYQGVQLEAISTSSDGSVCLICRSCKRRAQKEQAYGIGNKHEGKAYTYSVTRLEYNGNEVKQLAVLLAPKRLDVEVDNLTGITFSSDCYKQALRVHRHLV